MRACHCVSLLQINKISLGSTSTTSSLNILRVLVECFVQRFPACKIDSANNGSKKHDWPNGGCYWLNWHWLAMKT